jgi:hypothetical protein
MLVADTIGMAENLLLAYSDVEIEYVSYKGVGDSTPSTFKLKILSISGATPNASGKFKTYTVNMASKELIKSSSLNITQNFVDMSHDTMIGVLFGYLETDKSLKKESTKNIDTISVNKLKPFQAIDKIRHRAVSRTQKSSAYCFYETRLGYTFATIEDIIKEGKKDPSVVSGDRNFFLNSINKQESSDSDWRVILGFEHVKMENILDMIGSGGLKNNTWSFNVNTGQYYLTSFDKKENDGEFSLNPEAFNLLQTVSDEYGFKGNKNGAEASGAEMLVPIKDDRENDRIEKTSYIRAYVLKMVSNMMNIHIHGDSVLSAGSVIHIDFPKISDVIKNESNKLITGNYLITSIRHIIIPTGRHTYSQSCEILRTGFIGD